MSAARLFGNRRIAAVTVAILGAAFLVASLITTTGGASAQSGKKGTGPVIAHKPNGAASKSKAQSRLFRVGHNAAEPTVGVSKDGDVYFVAADISDLNRVEVLHSTNDAKSWDIISPRLGDQNIHRVTLDPYIYLDPRTDRLYTIDLTVACSILSYTDDKGASWITNPLACGVPINDHQTLFGGPPVSSPTVGYENVMYYCWNNIASSMCSKSLDGGLTFHPTGTPAFQGVKQGQDGGGFCGGIHGHGVVGDDGTVFLPREYCDDPYVAISHDEGQSWNQVKVSNMPVTGSLDPSVAVDSKGNVYYTWVGKDRLGFMSVSRDNGETWSKPVQVTPRGVNEVNLLTMDVGAPGKVAFAYMGTTNSPGAKNEFDNQQYTKTTWNGYVALSDNAFSKKPTFHTASINHPKQPIFRGRCGPGRCGAVFDFIDVVVAPNGRPYGAFVDGCDVLCEKGAGNIGSEGFVGTIVGGPRLR